MRILGRSNRSGKGGTRLATSRRWIVILVVVVLIILLLLSRGRQQPREPEPENPQDKEESMGRQQTSTASEERDAPPVNDEESGLIASRWFWRGLWALIAGLMLLLLFYEFVVLE